MAPNLFSRFRFVVAAIGVFSLFALGTPFLASQATAQDLCTISNFNGSVGDAEAALSAGDRVAVFYNPNRCDCSYPHRVESVSFSLAGDGAQWPVTVDVVVYERDSGIPNVCRGPGAEIHRVTVVCDQATFEYPNVGSVDIPPGDCLNGPVYVGIEMGAGNPKPTPQLVFDDEPSPEVCHLWHFSAADSRWYSFTRLFGDATPGHPLIDVTITEADSTCLGYSCEIEGDIDGNGQITIGDLTYWINWQFGGGPPPSGRLGDVNCDCLINEDDVVYFSVLFGCPFPPCQPVSPLCNCPEPYVEECHFIPGDADGSGDHSIGDAVYIINTIFNSGAPPAFPVGQQDANGDCVASIGDAVYIINFIFAGGPAPVGCEDWPTNCGGIY